jgi:hypothetical protein
MGSSISLWMISHKNLLSMFPLPSQMRLSMPIFSTIWPLHTDLLLRLATFKQKIMVKAGLVVQMTQWSSTFTTALRITPILQRVSFLTTIPFSQFTSLVGPDGQPGVMKLSLFTSTSPRRDTALESDIVVRAKNCIPGFQA